MLASLTNHLRSINLGRRLRQGAWRVQAELRHRLLLNQRFNGTVYAASIQPRLYELAAEHVHVVNPNRGTHFSVEPVVAEGVAKECAAGDPSAVGS